MSSTSPDIGAKVERVGPLEVRPHCSWRGRIIDALARPLDGKGAVLQGEEARALSTRPPSALERQRLGDRVETGISVIDTFTPLCHGQRVGIFAGSGVGKSSLLAMFARAKGFDVAVIALVGERGREVREFIEDGLGATREKSVCVVATGDDSALMRRLAPRTAMAVAEHFRDDGMSVLLIIDSITRYAHACREVAIAAGEAPVARGYAPSVFSELPLLLERAGPGTNGGSITGVFAVLVDGDDHNEPVADCIRGTLDGHIVLDRRIAEQGRYPAVNVLTSVSRLATKIWTAEERDLAVRLRRLVSRFEDSRDLRLMGAYQSGADAELDQAIAIVPRLYDALQQDVSERGSSDAFRALVEELLTRKALPPPT
ncbi:MAG: FliI/YscN family ATPase [Hyphomicrobiales bacterium]